MLRLLPYLPFLAGLASLLVAAASLFRRRKFSPASWFLVAGMTALAADSVLTGVSLGAASLESLLGWLRLSFIVKSIVPALWLYFSLTYSRGDYRAVVGRWRIPLLLAGLVPVALAVALRDQLFLVVAAEPLDQGPRIQVSEIGKSLNGVLLVVLLLILMNLEQTFRSAVGTMRWQIKFVVLGLAVIFGARLYVQSQTILFSVPGIALWGFESGALLIGCLFLAVAYVRTGLAEIDVYPSLAVVRSSLTIVIVGGYLFVVGVLAQVVKYFGGAEIFQFQAFVVLLGMAGLGLLLLSDRARQRFHVFVMRHFSKAQHDSVRVWTLFSRRLASVRDEPGLCDASAKLISETFEALSVTLWLTDEEKGQLACAASTAKQLREDDEAARADPDSAAVLAALRTQALPFDLEEVQEPWADTFRRMNPMSFPHGGHRWCVPLRAGDSTFGAIVLADRVAGAVYTVEEVELLNCIGAQVTSVLMNLRLASEVARAREMEAFRSMSAFFVHDLKNAAASLNLMLKNLPVHFDDPAFRQDALRGIGNTARRIDEMIARLSALRERGHLPKVEADLNQIVQEALDRINGMANVELSRDLHPLPRILADQEQLGSVVTNLVLNARDAVGSQGRIAVRTEHRDGRVLLSVADNGCGMSQAFMKDFLFRPFQSTKKQGLGIGLFQSRAIVQAHGGGMNVQSEVGKGTTFVVSLPAAGR